MKAARNSKHSWSLVCPVVQVEEENPNVLSRSDPVDMTKEVPYEKANALMVRISIFGT